MPKSTKHPKTQQMNRVNMKARLAMARAGALEKAYMNLSGIVIQHVRALEEGGDPGTGIIDLMQAWQKNDAMLRGAFVQIDESA